MTRYQEYIGRLIDQGWRNCVIARRVLRAAMAGKVGIPDRLYAICDRVVMFTNMPRSAAARRTAEAEFDAMEPTELFQSEEPRTTRVFRDLLQSPAVDIDLDPDRLRMAMAAMGLEFLDRLFPSDKSQALREIGIFTERGGWSEEIFQKFLYLMRQAENRQIKPGIEDMRLWTNDLVDLDYRLLRRTLPFNWMLRNDDLSPLQYDHIRRIAGLMLKRRPRDRAGEIAETIAAKDIRHIEKVCRWFFPEDVRHTLKSLDGLVAMVRALPGTPPTIIDFEAFGNWSNESNTKWTALKKATEFVNRHIDKSPDFELLSDYMNGIVNFAGRGKYRP